MAEKITQAIRFKSQKNGDTTPAEMQALAFTKQEQKSRALQTLALFWVIATVCVLIPIAHFFLVPGFLIGGAVAAKRRWDKDKEGLDARGECPACHHSIRIELDKNAELPQWHNCPECGDALELQAAPDRTEGQEKSA